MKTMNIEEEELQKFYKVKEMRKGMERKEIQKTNMISCSFVILMITLLILLLLLFSQCSLSMRSQLQKQMLSSNYEFESQKRQDRQLFAYSLFRRPQNQNLLEIEKKRFNSLYEIDEVEEQLPLCVTIVGYNTVQNYRNMLSSVFRQNYTNFHVVHIDDVSPEDAKLKLQKYVNHLSEVHPQKIQMIFNNKKQYALANRDKIIRNHCNPGEIIIDLDSDDALIGKQVFRLVNSFYQKDHDLWLFYMNNIVLRNGVPITLPNYIGGVPDDILQSNTYRTTKVWKSHHLRTYRRELYMKIDRNDFLNPDGEFYIWKADGFILFSLSEMAGKKHQKKIDEPVYFYYQPPKLDRHTKDKKFCWFVLKMQAPYLPLEDLSQEAKKTPNYVPPVWIKEQFMQWSKKHENNDELTKKNNALRKQYLYSDHGQKKQDQEINSREDEKTTETFDEVPERD